MMAERFPANQALEWGLINKVVDADSLMDEAMTVAERFASGPRSLTLIRKAYWESLNNGYDEQFKLEVALQNIAHQSNDNKEGVAAFLRSARRSSLEPNLYGERISTNKSSLYRCCVDRLV